MHKSWMSEMIKKLLANITNKDVSHGFWFIFYACVFKCYKTQQRYEWKYPDIQVLVSSEIIVLNGRFLEGHFNAKFVTSLGTNYTLVLFVVLLGNKQIKNPTLESNAQLRGCTMTGITNYFVYPALPMNTTHFLLICFKGKLLYLYFLLKVHIKIFLSFVYI